MGIKVKHMYKVTIAWLEHETEIRNVLAINPFQAKSKVIADGKDKGMYSNENSKAEAVKYNVAVVRD